MTPAELKRCRHTLGLTQAELARLLRLSGNGDRSIRHYEAGTKPVPGPISVVLDMLCNDYNPMAEFMAGPMTCFYKGVKVAVGSGDPGDIKAGEIVTIPFPDDA